MDVGGRLGTVGASGLGSRDGHIECEAMVPQGYSIKVQGRMWWQETATASCSVIGVLPVLACLVADDRSIPGTP